MKHRLKYIIAALVALSVLVMPLQSSAKRYHGRHHHHGIAVYRSSYSLVTIDTAAGKITVARHLAPKFKALIQDFVNAGYNPKHVHCHSAVGHVRFSRHHHGAACDFDQRGWGLTTNFMYHADKIIHKYGLRSGCDFRDCGHVDDGFFGRPKRYHNRHRRGYHRAYHRRFRRHR